VQNNHASPRTDLVAENAAISGKNDVCGVEKTTEKLDCFEKTVIRITTNEAADLLQKPVGCYITLDTPSLGNPLEKEEKAAAFLAESIKTLLPEEGCVLIAGLGNPNITPDALGPLCAEKILPTRHLHALFRDIPLRETVVLTPGVLGQTGMEAAKQIKAIANELNPAAVLVVDALAAGNVRRLGRTVQLCDSGIAPGSGVQNRRKELSERTVGCPVIAIGVPMVIDFNRKEDPAAPPMMVTPQEVDTVVRNAAGLIALAVNFALQPALSAKELALLF